MTVLRRYVKSAVDVIVTLTLWFYYIVGWLAICPLFYLLAYCFSENRERAFQRLNYLFHRSFFLLLRLITPGLRWRVQSDIREIRSSVVVANHLSYLDPILLVSLFAQQKTIVKKDFFSYPVFGWLLKTSGYLPSTAAGDFSPMMIARVEAMADYLAAGGNLFVFPEAHRSRDGRVGPFNKGVFTIARRCRAPITVLSIRNTDRLFTPDRYLFNTCISNPMDVSIIARLTPDYESDAFSLPDLMAEVRALMEDHQGRQP